MFLNFMFIDNTSEERLVRVRPYELALYLKSHPRGCVYSILETVWDKYGLIEDYFDDDSETWYSGFAMPPTWWLVNRIRAEYGPDPLWIKVPDSLMNLVEAAKQPPKRRWRTSGRWLKINKKYHRPWWM